MYKNKKIVAIIPARKGSKGVKDKNTKSLMGIPLVVHTIQQVKKANLIDKVIVSTDSEEIFTIAKEYGAEIKGLRPEELSNDTAILYYVLKHEIINHSLDKEGFDIIVLLQPTSPLRQSWMIDDALINFVNKDLLSAVSVSEVWEHPILMRTINQEGNLESLLDINSTVRKQDLPKFYRVNGMIYINRIVDIINNYVSFNDNISPIIISKEYDIDIDTIDDFEEAEKRLLVIANKNLKKDMQTE